MEDLQQSLVWKHSEISVGRRSKCRPPWRWRTRLEFYSVKGSQKSLGSAALGFFFFLGCPWRSLIQVLQVSSFFCPLAPKNSCRSSVVIGFLSSGFCFFWNRTFPQLLFEDCHLLVPIAMPTVLLHTYFLDLLGFFAFSPSLLHFLLHLCLFLSLFHCLFLCLCLFFSLSLSLPLSISLSLSS